MIIAKDLSKSFGDFLAVQGLHLEVHAGECFGLLGPNGAGKSTFISMTYGATLKSSGDLKVLGLDPHTQSRLIKKRLGIVTQENALDESLSVSENMLLYAAFLGVPAQQRMSRIDELLEYMNLSHKKNANIQSLSGGMKRRLVFVRALLGKPELLILDEPTTGLDPSVRHLLWGKVKELKNAGTTIVLTTHYMHEAEVLCDRIVIMNKGKQIAEGSPKNLIAEHTPGAIGIYSPEYFTKLKSLEKAEPDLHVYQDASSVYLRAKNIENLSRIHQQYQLLPLQIRPSNLEDVFLQLTGQEISQDD